MVGGSLVSRTPKLRQHRGAQRTTVLTILLFLCAVLLVLVLFRFAYFNTKDGIVRIDRLTGATCVAYPTVDNASALGALPSGNGRDLLAKGNSC